MNLPLHSPAYIHLDSLGVLALRLRLVQVTGNTNTPSRGVRNKSAWRRREKQEVGRQMNSRKDDSLR